MDSFGSLLLQLNIVMDLEFLFGFGLLVVMIFPAHYI